MKKETKRIDRNWREIKETSRWIKSYFKNKNDALDGLEVLEKIKRLRSLAYEIWIFERDRS